MHMRVRYKQIIMRCRAADCVLPPEFLGHEIIILTSDVKILIINMPEAG